MWPGEDAIGRSFRRGRADVFQVVGIVANAKIQGFEKDPGLVGYLPYGLNTRTGLSLVVRGNNGDAAAIAGARRVVKVLDPDLPLRRVRTLDSVVDDALAMRRFQMRLLAAFGAAGLILACLGIYGVLSAMVESRRAELAIRLALGAPPTGVRWLMVRQGLRHRGLRSRNRPGRRSRRRAVRRLAALRRHAGAAGRPGLGRRRRSCRGDRRVSRARRPRCPHVVGVSVAVV